MRTGSHWFQSSLEEFQDFERPVQSRSCPKKAKDRTEPDFQALVLAAPDATITGHKCTMEGRVPHENKVQKICNWPKCATVSQVHRFLGTCSVVCIFICNFAFIAHLLVDLTRKGVPFIWGDPQ